MDINADFTQRAAVHAADLPWTPSPMPGVDRRMLDRLGDEVARATSIVRYAPGSAFSPHVHTGGEEFLVLDGVFSDEHGDFPAGSYIRNPPQSRHSPGSLPGCIIFVKLWQFDLADRTHVRIDTAKMRFLPKSDGIEVMPLFSDSHEDVVQERWERGTAVDMTADGGAEILVLQGGFDEGGEAFGPQGWLRLPRGGRAHLVAGPDGALVWIKRGHLSVDPAPPVA
jgi:quercetin dioxygenase-like cupin family protein